MLPTALAAADLLAAQGTAPVVFSCASVKPLDTATLARVFADHEAVVTLEEHGLIGGFGSAVAEWLADQPCPPRARLLRAGTADRFLHEPGEQDHARATYGLTPGDIARAQKELDRLLDERAALEDEFEEKVARVKADYAEPRIDPYPVRPRKNDVTVEKVALAWMIT